MFSQDFGNLFTGGDAIVIQVIHTVGLGLYFLSAVLTVTSGWSYLKRHAHVIAD